MSAIFNNAVSVTQSNRLSVMTATVQSGRRVSQRRGPYLYTFDVTTRAMETTSAIYKDIRKEISNMDYGVDALSTTIPYLTKDNGSWSGTPIVATTETLTGSINPTASINLVGVGTLFTTELVVGDYITVSGETRMVATITNNLELIVTLAFTDTANDTSPVKILSHNGRTVGLSGFTSNASDVILDGDFIQFGNNTKVYQAVGDYNADSTGYVAVYLNTPMIEPPVSASTVIHGESVAFSLVINEAEFSTSFTPQSVAGSIATPATFSFTELIT